MTKRKTKAPAVVVTTMTQTAAPYGWAKWRDEAEASGIVVRSVDRDEFARMCDRAQDLGVSIGTAVTAFIAARAAIAGTLVGKQRPEFYVDDRRRAFAAARHACIIPEA